MINLREVNNISCRGAIDNAEVRGSTLAVGNFFCLFCLLAFCFVLFCFFVKHFSFFDRL